MKTLMTIIAVLAISLPLKIHAQDFSELKSIKISDSLSCSLAQKKVLECSEYLFANPCVENLPNLNATTFIIKWMEATPVFTFSLDRKFYKAIKSDINLSGRYYASLAKTAIENNYTKNSIELQLRAISLLLEYCEKPKNYVKITKKLRKYIEAKNNNSLKELIKV
jgi:hypothetical protein